MNCCLFLLFRLILWCFARGKHSKHKNVDKKHWISTKMRNIRSREPEIGEIKNNVKWQNNLISVAFGYVSLLKCQYFMRNLTVGPKLATQLQNNEFCMDFVDSIFFQSTLFTLTFSFAFNLFERSLYKICWPNGFKCISKLSLSVTLMFQAKIFVHWFSIYSKNISSFFTPRRIKIRPKMLNINHWFGFRRCSSNSLSSSTSPLSFTTFPLLFNKK